mmetsp:Transcript_13634/g.48130  ORF Transcript_13634/g.48130 Transcript_13634/m.48130 type:complete len:501 (-) Transcript_13634:263-1765(-)
MSAMMPLSSIASSVAVSGKESVWRYDAGDEEPLVIRAEPAVDGKRTESALMPGTIFSVREEKVEEDGILYLSLADGRGWVFDRKPGVGTMCERHGEHEANFWRYDAGDGQPLILRKAPRLDGERTDRALKPGEVFAVAREQEGPEGVTFLRLADGRGWAFDRKPGFGAMCERHGVSEVDKVPSPYWRYVAKDNMPIFVRKAPDIDAPRTQEHLQPGELFFVSEEQRGADGVLYLKLADGSGWLFDTKPGVGAMCKRHEAPVILHIYDVPSDPTALRINGMLRALGTGAFHAAVEVYGLEFSFGANHEGEGGTGVFTCPPKGCEGHTYRESLSMGHSAMTEDEARAMIGRMSKAWLAKDYDILRKNCCHFSDSCCEKLQVGNIPSWVRNLSGAGRALDDRRASFSEALAPVVADAKDMLAAVLARGKAARGSDPSEDWRHGDFTLGLVSAAAAAAEKVAATIDSTVGVPQVNCSTSANPGRREVTSAQQPQKFLKQLDCGA